MTDRSKRNLIVCAEDLDVPLDIQNWIGALSEGTGVHEIVFRQTSGAYDLSWHTAPCRQFIIMINGGRLTPLCRCSTVQLLGPFSGFHVL